MSTGPLSGLRVLDFTTGRLTMAGGLMAEYGATVIKVEQPEGDPTRWELPTVHATNDRGKRSIVLDFESPDDRDILGGLIDTSDVLVENWGEGREISYEKVHARNPRLVYCSVTGWGEGRLDRGRPCDEPLVDAWVGTMEAQRGYRDGPLFYGMPMATTGASYLAVIGVLGALYRRIDDGIGRHVTTSLVDGSLAYLGCHWRDVDVPISAGMTNIPRARLLVTFVCCGDGKYLGIHTGAVGAFDRLIQAVGLDSRIALSKRGQSIFLQTLTDEEASILDEEIPKLFAGRSRDEWEKVLLAADVCAVPCMAPGQMFDHPQALANDMVVTVDDPHLGPITQIGVATRFSRTPGAISGPAPELGQHTREIIDEEVPPVQVSDQDSTGSMEDRPVLDGLKVLDLGQYYAGPFGPRLLADLGADVIKLEPLGGDPGYGQDWGETAQFRKRSIAVDLKTDDGRRIAQRLLQWTDILHHNMRPGVAERLGIGYDHARALNPDIIYDFAPGWGTTGDYITRQGFAPMYSGFTGVTFEVAGEGNPPIMPAGHEDPGNGLLGAAGMLAAALYRRRTGEGQFVEHSQLSATMTHMRHIVRTPDGTVLGASGLDHNQLGTGPLSRLYQTTDGWICVVATSDEEFSNLVRALGDSRLVRDDRFSSAANRKRNERELGARLETLFGTMSTAQCMKALDEHNVPNEIPTRDSCKVLFTDALSFESRRVTEWRDRRRGKVREIDQLIRISDAVQPEPHRRPDVGEHTAEILLSLGYSPAEINDFYRNGIVV